MSSNKSSSVDAMNGASPEILNKNENNCMELLSCQDNYIGTLLTSSDDHIAHLSKFNLIKNFNKKPLKSPKGEFLFIIT